MTAYNVQAAQEDIIITEGDTPNMTYSITENGVAYDMTGMLIEIDVRKNNGTLIRTFSTTAASVVITVDQFTIVSVTPCDTAGRYKYDVQVTDGTEILTIMKGNFIVQREVTL